MKFVVMAGGQGTKLWPLSREATPKQFIPIVGEKTLFQLNIDALLTKFDPKDIFVSTNDSYLDFINKQAPMIPEENYIIEPPLKRMTGPASGYSMLKVASKYPDEVVMFYVQPVVIRTPVEKYVEMVEGIEKLVKKHNKLVTGGMFPLYPETGSDYLQLGERVADTGSLEVYNKIKFVPRPKTYEESETMLSEMHLALHCNHLTWTPEGLLTAFKDFRPDWYKVLAEIKDVLGTKGERQKVTELYEKFEPGNIDAPLISAVQAQIVILPFMWRHITTWHDVYEFYKAEGIKTIQGNVIDYDGENNLIISKDKKLVTTIGVKDFVIINNGDSILICPQKMAGRLGMLLENIRQSGIEGKL